jgi:hypothetical protein
MVQVKLNDALNSLLGPIKEKAQIINPDGTLFGYFEPAIEQEEAEYRKAALLFSPEEIEPCGPAQPTWRTTSEVLERLRSLENA